MRQTPQERTLAAATSLLFLCAAWPLTASAEPPSGLGPAGPAVLIGQAGSGRQLDELPPPRQAADRGLLVAIDTPYQIFENQGSYVHVGAWQTSGRPAAGAGVFVGDVEVGRTDAGGTLVFRYPPQGSGQTSAVGAGRITVVDAADPSLRGTVPFRPSLRTESFASDHLFVYTDRGVYRPGERIRLRLVAWHLKEDYRPLRDARIEVFLKGPDDQLIGGTRPVTNDFGVAASELTVPATAPEGLYRLEVAYKQARESTRLQVKEFQPPDILIEHTLARFLTKDQAELVFDVRLALSAGGAVGKATVTARFTVGGRERARIAREVDGGGPHRLRLSARELARVRAALTEGRFVTVTLEVKDTEGREDSVDREMRYAENPYVAVLEMDKDQYTTGDPVEIVAKLSDLDHAPLRDRAVALVVGEQRLEGRTDTGGMAHFSLRMPDTTVSVELFVPGVDQAVASGQLTWAAPKAMRSHIATPVLRERVQAEVVVHFPAGIEPAEAVVHMDVIDTSGALVNAVLLPVGREDGKPVARGRFDAPSWGSMLLTFFALGRPPEASGGDGPPHHALGLLTEGQNLVVQPDRTLEITLKGWPESAKPGAEIEWETHVADAQGRPVRASVGAAIVDRRVLALKDPLEITPMDQLYRPELRTMSTTGSKILSWPVVSRNWGERVHDVALPPFPYLDGGRLRARSGRSGGADPEPSPDVDADGVMDELDAPVHSLEPPPPPQASQPSMMPARPGPSAPPEPPAAPAITIRTRFPETSLWEPLLTADPAVTVRAVLPEAIAEQELIVVASDASGGIGVHRARVRVSQPLYVQLDLPDVLHVGETLAVPAIVRNGTDAPLTLTITAAGRGVVIEAPSAPLTLAAGATGAAWLKLRAESAGPVTLDVQAASGTVGDRIQRTVHAAPEGVAEVTLHRARLTGGSVELTWTVPEGVESDATLRVLFPSVTTAFLDAAGLAERVGKDPFGLATDLLSAALVLRYAAHRDMASAPLDQLHTLVSAALPRIEQAQRTDGAFTWWRSGAPSPYVTAWVLEGLLAARRVPLPVSAAVIRAAAEYLTTALDADGLIQVADIAWWEGDTRAVREGLTAEVADVLSQIPAGERSQAVRDVLEKLTPALRTMVSRSAPEPLSAGRALTALLREAAITADEARAAIRALLERRDRGHWEPSWFHAYGGRVEATAAVLAAMHALDPAAFATEKRDAVAWLLSTREAWGQWHNERGTATTIRALLAVGAPAGEVGGTVAIHLDGELLREVAIRADDPLISALELSHLALKPGLRPGRHTVEVRYDGDLAPAVVLAARSWRRGAQAVARAGGVVVRTRAPDELRVGEAGELRVTLELADSTTPATILVAPSTLLDWDAGRMDPLDGVISDWRVGEHGLELTLAPHTRRGRLTIPVLAARAGKSSWPTVGVILGSDRARATPGSLVVR